MAVTDLRAIETIFRGYRFRSRLEARWASFFETLGVQWEYEPEGYEIGGQRYLPDFYLPASRMFIEVKPRRGEHVDEKPMAAVRTGRDMFAFTSKERWQMVVVYGDPLNAESDEIAWFLDAAYVSRGGAAKVCPSCRTVDFDGVGISVTSTWDTDTGCSCGRRTLPTFQAFVVDAALAARQARFEHGQQPETTARIEHRCHDTAPNIYLAGKIHGDNWRNVIGAPSGDYSEKNGRLFRCGDRIETKYRPWTYNGPDLDMQHGVVGHGVVDDCLRRVARSNMLFAWIDQSDIHGTMAELGFWHGLGRGEVVGFSFVAFASHELREDVWFASRLATVAVVVPTIQQAWDAFLEWDEYGRCYQGALP